MNFHYSKQNLDPGEAKLQRALEILPGAVSWATLIILVLLSIFFPFTAAILIVAFYLCWLLRLLYMTLFLVLSYVQLDKEKDTDWMARIAGLNSSLASKDITHLVFTV